MITKYDMIISEIIGLAVKHLSQVAYWHPSVRLISVSILLVAAFAREAVGFRRQPENRYRALA